MLAVFTVWEKNFMQVIINSKFCTVAEGRLKKILIGSDFVMMVLCAQLKMTSNCLTDAQ